MAKAILHLDIGNTVTQARVWKESGDDLRFMGSSVTSSPPSLGKADLAAGAHIAYAGVKAKLARNGIGFDPDDILVTVSAAGEPRAVCAGVVKGISGESAKRAALLAGATVTDLIAVDDGRHEYQRVSDLRRQEISMVVMAGGVDDEILGTGRHQLFNVARVVAEGLPERRSGGRKVPLVYAASQEGREEVLKIFGDSTDIIWADNVRARLEEEHLESARNAVVGVFTGSVRHDPRFSGLGRLGAATMLPSGHSVGLTVERVARSLQENMIVISLDGDSVQVFSVIKGVFTRTVTPVERVQAKEVLKWLPSPALGQDLPETLANWKMHPGTLPGTWDDLAVFLAIQKEAVLQAIAEHSQSSIELRGIHRQRQIGETFQVNVQGGETLVKMERVSTICVTGFLAGLLSPAVLMSLVLDAAAPCGVTKVYADTDGVLQVYGVLQTGDATFVPQSAMRPIGVVLSPGRNEERVGTKWAYSVGGTGLEPLPVKPGEISLIDVQSKDGAEFELHPGSKVDVGDGEGRNYRSRVVGFEKAYIDGRQRGRKSPERYQENRAGYRSVGAFPTDVIAGWERGRS